MKQLDFLTQCNEPSEKKEHIQSTWQLYIDGASRNNPGPAGIGIYILKDGSFFYAQGFYVGTKTNNEAEYIALLLGIFIAKGAMGADDILYIASDSQLVVKQLRKEFRVIKPEIRVLYDMAIALLSGITYSVCHIRREQNSNADALANKGIDTHNPLPQDFVAYAQRYRIIF